MKPQGLSLPVMKYGLNTWRYVPILSVSLFLVQQNFTPTWCGEIFIKQEHADAETLRSSGCPIYKELCIIFSEPATNGKHDHPAEHEEGTPNFRQSEPLSFQQEVLSSSESEEADDAVDDKETVQPTTPSSAGIRKRGRKGVDDAIARAILEMATASKLRTAAIQQRSSRYTIANCIKELDEMKGVEEQVYFAALDLFNKPIAREVFLSLKRDKRLIWLQRQVQSSWSWSLDYWLIKLDIVFFHLIYNMWIFWLIYIGSILLEI